MDTKSIIERARKIAERLRDFEPQPVEVREMWQSPTALIRKTHDNALPEPDIMTLVRQCVGEQLALYTDIVGEEVGRAQRSAELEVTGQIDALRVEVAGLRDEIQSLRDLIEATQAEVDDVAADIEDRSGSKLTPVIRLRGQRH